jgi:hypothetical protein
LYRIVAEKVSELTKAHIHPYRDALDYDSALAEIDTIVKENPGGNAPNESGQYACPCLLATMK